eukprot:631735-Rhodomonas_salina.1
MVGVSAERVGHLDAALCHEPTAPQHGPEHSLLLRVVAARRQLELARPIDVQASVAHFEPVPAARSPHVQAAHAKLCRISPRLSLNSQADSTVRFDAVLRLRALRCKPRDKPSLSPCSVCQVRDRFLQSQRTDSPDAVLFSLVVPVSYTHLTLPTICSV